MQKFRVEIRHQGRGFWLLLVCLFLTASCVGRTPEKAPGVPAVSGELELKSPPRPKAPAEQ